MFESSRFTGSQSSMHPSADLPVEEKTNTPLEKDPATMGSAINRVEDSDTHGNTPPVSEIISQEFPPFDAETLIFHPILEEESNDERFYKELGEYLIESLLTFHAWAAARPRLEHNVICDLITSKMAKIEETEKDQEQNRKRLADFVERMTSAVAALAENLGSI